MLIKFIKLCFYVYHSIKALFNQSISDYAFLLFYHPKEVLETGEVVFNTDLKKMKVNVKNAQKIFTNALKLLNSDCPKKSCVWCEGKVVYLYIIGFRFNNTAVLCKGLYIKCDTFNNDKGK